MISGYPRSGSTMLTSILNQNPRFQSEITDGLLPLVKNMWETMQRDPSVERFVDDDKRKAILLAAINTFYKDSKPVVFNTNRAWTANLPLLHELFPRARVIAMVRNVVNVLNSFEVLYQNNPISLSRIYSPSETANVYRRTHDLMADGRPVLLGLTSLKEGLVSTQAPLILMIDYVTFCADPISTMKAIYEFIEQPYYEHDFENIEMNRAEYDGLLKAPGLHVVRKKLEYVQQPMLLPKDLQDYYQKFNI